MSLLHKTRFPTGIENMGCRRRGSPELDEVLESIYMVFQEKGTVLLIPTLCMIYAKNIIFLLN